jgi:hypothetical protein
LDFILSSAPSDIILHLSRTQIVRAFLLSSMRITFSTHLIFLDVIALIIIIGEKYQAGRLTGSFSSFQLLLQV